MGYPPDEWFQLSADSIAEILTRKTGHPWIGIVKPRDRDDRAPHLSRTSLEINDNTSTSAQNLRPLPDRKSAPMRRPNDDSLNDAA